MDDYDSFERRHSAARPWVTFTVSVACAVCTVAMAADAFNGFRRKELWFPCKYFSLNAITLTLLGLAVKLAVDINNDMIYTSGLFAKISSLIFMSVALGNFTSSLGSMSDKDILAYVVAVGMLVIKIVGSVLIQLNELWYYLGLGYKIVLLFTTYLMLLLLSALVSLAVTVSTIKRRLEVIYQEKHKETTLRDEEESDKREGFNIEDRKAYMMKYFVMAETSSPQFVMARSAVSTTSALNSLLAAITLPFVFYQQVDTPLPSSMFGDFTLEIIIIQVIGVVVGVVAPTLRWYVAVSFKCSATNQMGFKVENHWILSLLDCRKRSVVQIRPGKYRKYLHNAKWYALTFSIGLQNFIVLFSKYLVFLSALLIHKMRREVGGDTDSGLSDYVLLLEGEEALPRGVLKSICHQADNIFQTGKKKQPKDLNDFLKQKFVDFRGLGEFDSNQIKSLHSEEPPNCWTLPVMTLTSIAVALPNISKDNVKGLLSSVSEGFSLAKFVDKTLDTNAQLMNFREAAIFSWVGVIFYMKWLDMDLEKASLESTNSEEVLHKLFKEAEGVMSKFKNAKKDPVMENPPNWPPKVVAANSMYRISQTILLSLDRKEEQTDDGLFQDLSAMIAGVLAACFTNLPRAITTICHINEIEKRGKSVRKAFRLLGKTEKVVEFVQQKDCPFLDHDKKASIQEWRAFFQQVNGNAMPPTSSSTPVCSVVLDC